METATRGARSGTHNGKTGGSTRRGHQQAHLPATVQRAKRRRLTPEHKACGITARVMVPENAEDRQRQLLLKPPQLSGDAWRAIAEIADQQQCIGGKLVEHGMVVFIPLPMEVAGDRQAQGCWKIRQRSSP